MLLLIKSALKSSCNAPAQEQHSYQIPRVLMQSSRQSVPYLREDVGALLQQRHWWVADARR